MLLPKRVKFRKQHRGRMTGKAMRGNTVSHGEYGLQALPPACITSNQIEAARIALTRYITRAVRFGSRSSQISLQQESLLELEWVKVRAHLSIG